MVRDKVLFVGAGTNACATSVRSVGQVDHEWDADLVLLLDHVGERRLVGGVLAVNSVPAANPGLAANFEPTKVGKRTRSHKPIHLRCPASGHGGLRVVRSNKHERALLRRINQCGRTGRDRGYEPLRS
jgi:hypothetical protein